MSQPGTTQDDEAWKEQFGFVSGTVLVWGVILLQLWPAIAGVQIGKNVQAIPARGDWPVSVAVFWFQALTLGIALGLGVILFGVLHVITRGLWLERFSLADPPSSHLSERISHRAYVILHVYWLLLVAYVLLLAPTGVLIAVADDFLVRQAAWTPWAARLVVALVLTAVFIPALFINRYRWRRFVKNQAALGMSNYLIASIIATVLWFGAIEFCYVTTLRIDRHLFEKSKDSYVTLFVDLGGSASAIADARLYLENSSRRIPLSLRPVANGTYIAIEPLSQLPPGEYTARLDYPHWSASLEFPFLSTSVKRQVGLIVVP